MQCHTFQVLLGDYMSACCLLVPSFLRQYTQSQYTIGVNWFFSVAEYRFIVTSLHCVCDRLFVGTRSGHIVVIDSDSLSVISTFHGFCENVTSLLSLPKSSWNLLPAVSGHTIDVDDASQEPSCLTPYLVSVGNGLQGYGHGQGDGSVTGFMLLWNIDSL